MKNLRKLFNKSDRKQAAQDVQKLRCYIEPILRKKQENKCYECHEELEYCEIHHIVYNPKVTINELKLLCFDCHLDKHRK